MFILKLIQIYYEFSRAAGTSVLILTGLWKLRTLTQPCLFFFSFPFLFLFIYEKCNILTKYIFISSITKFFACILVLDLANSVDREVAEENQENSYL